MLETRELAPLPAKVSGTAHDARVEAISAAERVQTPAPAERKAAR